MQECDVSEVEKKVVVEMKKGKQGEKEISTRNIRGGVFNT